MRPDESRDGRRLERDPEAESASDDLPAFLARPDGAPLYHGFSVWEEVEVEGFRLGAISEFGPGITDGDAFVVAPDGSRAGLVWEVGDEARIEQVSGFEPGRWGVWEVTFPREFHDASAARKNLAALLPELRQHWEDWHGGAGARDS